MFKIDTTAISGYESMSPEEKLSALEAFEFEDGSADLERYKNAVSKANTEAAEWKRKHKALLSEEEQKRIDSAEEINNMRAELEELKRQKAVSEHKVRLIGLGYDEALAGETAQAFVENDTARVFDNQKKFLEMYDKKIRADVLKKTPTPPAGMGENSMTLERLRAMSPNERLEFSVKSPEEYKRLYGGNE